MKNLLSTKIITILILLVQINTGFAQVFNGMQKTTVNKKASINSIYENMTTSQVQNWLYGIDLDFLDSSSNLFVLDVDNVDNILNLGETGVLLITDIAFLPDGRLFGVTSTDLYEININTNSASLVGAFNTSAGVNSLVANTENTFLAATTEGSLIQIDSFTGAGTVIGLLGSNYSSSGDLTFDLNGDLYGVVHIGFSTDTEYLVKINTTTGVATEIGIIGLSDVFGLMFDYSGNLFGVANANLQSTPTLISIDKNTGIGSFLGDLPTNNGMSGLAKIPDLIFRDSFE